ncbi:MAG TPA: tyrosine-type recombinase/integrase [Terriglobia bacterium]|nr:tyrosine-type recombinase/integrase [Terriglobia bacterium]
MRWEVEPNAFLARLSLVNGRTSSTSTWRSYAYQFADWLSFCEKIGVQWRHVTELNIATYRNILASESSPQINRPLKRSTINHKLTVICQFYRFAHRKGWVDALPFELGAARIPYSADLTRQAEPNCRVLAGNNLRLRELKEELRIPSRQEVRHFIKSFRTWRDQLIAEIMWLTGMRSKEVCSLPLDVLPEDPGSIENETVAVKITGKGQKRRAVLFPVRLLRSIDRYVHMERWRRVRSSRESPGGSVFVGRTGKPLHTSAINRAFSTNYKRTGLHIWPHLLRHGYAVERLAYLEDIGAPNPLKVVQMELGHAHMATTERYLHLTERMRSEVIETHNSFVDRLLE